MTSTSAADRLSRLLALVPWLMQHDGVTIDVAADHFAVTTEQLEKDLWLLIVCGLPGYGPDQLVDIQFWDDGIHVIDPQVLDRPLRLTEAEASAMTIAVHLLAQVPGLHDRDALVSLMAKLEDALGASEALPVVLDTLDETTLATVQEALRTRSALRIRYAGLASDMVTERVVRPIELVSSTTPLTLLAYCESAEANRMFRVDRILSVELLEDHLASTPQDSDVVGHVQDPQPNPPPEQALVMLDPQVRWAVDVYAMREAVTGPDGRTRAYLPYWDPRWVVRLALSMRGFLQVLEPVVLRTAVTKAAEEALAGYADAT